MFDFLNNITDKAKSVASSIGSTISNAFASQPKSTFKASVGEGLSPEAGLKAHNIVTGKPVNTPAPTGTQFTNVPGLSFPTPFQSTGTAKALTSMNNVSKTGGLTQSGFSGGLASGGLQMNATPGLAFDSTPKGTPFTGVIPKTSTVRQATTPTSAGSTPNYSGSNAPFIQGGQYLFDPLTGRATPLAQSFSGAQGAGGLSFSSQGVSATGQQGNRMFSIGSSPLGELSSGTAALGDVDEEGKPRKKFLQGTSINPTTGQFEGMSPPPVQPVMQPTAPQAIQQTAGATTPAQGTQVQQTRLPSTPSSSLVQPFREEPFRAPTLPQTVDATSLEKYISDASSYVNAPGSRSASDLADIAGNLRQVLDIGVERIMRSKGMTPEKNLIEETPELSEFLNSLEGNDKFNYQSFADSFLVQNGMSDYVKYREANQAAIRVATEELSKFVKDVKSNPDLPKALKARRIEMFKEQTDAIINAAKEAVEMSSSAISDINNALNTQLGIVSAQRSEDDRKRQASFDVFKTLVDAGASFEGADKELWAKRLGVSTKTLDSLRNKVAPEDKFVTENGVIYQFRDGELYKQYGTPKTPQGGAGDLSATQVSVLDRLTRRHSAIFDTLGKADKLASAIQGVKQNPGGAAQQLNLIYGYIKGLDTDSAVREGEIDLLNSLQSYTTRFQTSIEKINQNKAISNDIAIAMADGAQSLVDEIYRQARTAEARISASANTMGVRNEYGTYINSEGVAVPQTPSYGQGDDEADALIDASIAPQQTQSNGVMMDTWNSIKNYIAG